MEGKMSIWKEVRLDEREKPSLISEILDWALHLGIALLVAFLVIKFVGQLTIVSGESMEPTLNGGDKIIMEKITNRFSEVERGDIVVIDAKEKLESHGYDPSTSNPLIKRIIGIEGDIISIENGYVYRNGEIIEELYVDSEGTFEDGGEYVFSITVPNNCIYILGDNRHKGKSLDSRKLGVFKVDDIKGRAVLRIFPFNSFGFL
jgi:signal peptidase I